MQCETTSVKSIKLNDSIIENQTEFAKIWGDFNTAKAENNGEFKERFI